MNDVIKFPEKNKYLITFQSTITIDVEVEAPNLEEAKNKAISNFKNGGVSNGSFSQTKYIIVKSEDLRATRMS